MIESLAHLKWGLYRLYVDALLYFGNIRTAFRKLRDLSIEEIAGLFRSERFDTAAIKRRGPPLPLKVIAKDSRYLISEMACKSYGDPGQTGDLRGVLVEAYKAHAAAGNPSPTIRELLTKESYGKDAEAAMALSLGKPVIFYCDQEQRRRFYRDVHPLSRLIEFETGIAVGAMVTDKLEDVSDLIHRLFEKRIGWCITWNNPSLVFFA